MDSFERFKDLLAITIAVIAIALSLVTVLIQRRQHQHQAFQQLHDTLMSPDHQRGRWLMWDIGDTGRLPERSTADYYLINRTLGTLNLLALYTQHGLIPHRWVLEVWHHPLRHMTAAVTLLVDDRMAVAQWRPWPQLDRLVGQAQTFHSSAGCCLAAPPNPNASRRLDESGTRD